MNLYNISLISVDCVSPVMACRALKYSTRSINFGEVILFTSEEFACQGVSLYKIEKLSDLASYSRFIVKELFKYISTDFIISVQADGFIINPNLWRNEFLDYDYIGSPWPPDAPWCTQNRVGNGGFSLRSRRFVELAAQLDVDFKHEDVLLTNTCFDYFVSNGCRFAPVEVAMKFSLESRIPECNYNLDNCFGFHGKGDAFYHYGNGQQFKDKIAILDTVSCSNKVNNV